MQSVLQCCGFKNLHKFIVVLSLLKLYFFLPPFHALSSFLVRHFHVLHFHVLQFPVLYFHVLQFHVVQF